MGTPQRVETTLFVNPSDILAGAFALLNVGADKAVAVEMRSITDARISRRL